MHEWAKTVTAIVNTLVILIGATFAYLQFKDRSWDSAASKSEESYKKVEDLTESGGFLLGYYFNEDVNDLDTLYFGNKELIAAIDDALGYYLSVRLCVDTGRCDASIIRKWACPYILSDATVINRTYVASFKLGGAFMDRPRLWSFYEQVEDCISGGEFDETDYGQFSTRFKEEIDRLDTESKAMFDFLHAQGWSWSPDP